MPIPVVGPAAGSLRARASATLADLVPILTRDGSTAGKLFEVARQLTIHNAYETVDFIILEGDLLESLRHHLVHSGRELLVADREASVQRRDAFSAFAQFDSGEQAVVYSDVQADDRLSNTERQMVSLYGLGSVLAVPLVWNGVLRGAFAASSMRVAAFDESDALHLIAVAGLVSALVKSQRMVEDLAAANERISRLHDDTVMMLAKVAEAHDEATGIHLRSMRAVTELLAQELGFSAHGAASIGQAAVLHDLGKVRVSSRILTKSGRLTSRERDVIRQHPAWGEELLTGRPGFELAARVARWHHERWDGNGYPDGLSGERIPLEVAIVTVADSYDTILSPRAYKSSRSRDWALREIQRCSGEQFNARVVDAFSNLYERGLIPHLDHYDTSDSEALPRNTDCTPSPGARPITSKGNWHVQTRAR